MAQPKDSLLVNAKEKVLVDTTKMIVDLTEKADSEEIKFKKTSSTSPAKTNVKFSKRIETEQNVTIIPVLSFEGKIVIYNKKRELKGSLFYSFNFTIIPSSPLRSIFPETLFPSSSIEVDIKIVPARFS